MRKHELLIALFLLLFTSCIFDKHDDDSKKEVKRRTILAYLGRDNDLSTSDEEKMRLMAGGWDGKGGNLIVYQDLPEGAAFYEIRRERNENVPHIIYEKPEENSADPTVFARIVKTMIDDYPAESYGLIVFSHGFGWLPEDSYSKNGVVTRSFIKDKSSYMELWGFAAAIPDSTFDFILFESCLMAGVEVAYELKNKTNYVLASSTEIVSPGFRNVYASSMNELFEPTPNLQVFSKAVFEDARTSYWKSGTFSLIKTSGMDALAAWVREYTVDVIYPDVAEVQEFSGKGMFYDFEDFFSRMTIPETTPESLTGLLENCIVYQNATSSFLGRFSIKKHSGLTVYVPQERYPDLNEYHLRTQWGRAIRK